MRILNTKTFTCKQCGQKKKRGQLAMATQQCGLCLGCYEEGWRVTIQYVSQFAYETIVVDVDDPRHPPRWVSSPQGRWETRRGAHDLITESRVKG